MSPMPDDPRLLSEEALTDAVRALRTCEGAHETGEPTAALVNHIRALTEHNAGLGTDLLRLEGLVNKAQGERDQVSGVMEVILSAELVCTECGHKRPMQRLGDIHVPEFLERWRKAPWGPSTPDPESGGTDGP